jgi:hypothetical protein
VAERQLRTLQNNIATMNMKEEKMNKRILTFVLTALLVMGSVAPVLAEEPDPPAQPAGSIEIEPGDLSLTTQETVEFPGFTYDGQAHPDIESSNPAIWNVADFRGSGDGWKITVQASNFVNTENSELTIAASNFEIQLLDEHVKDKDHDGQGVFEKPASEVTGYADLDGEKTLVAAEEDTGMNAYTLEPTFRLSVPANTYAGEYNATVTVTLHQGPN